MYKLIRTISSKLIEPLMRVRPYLFADVYFGRCTTGLPHGSLVFFPLQPNLLSCGIAGIVTFINQKTDKISLDISSIPLRRVAP